MRKFKIDLDDFVEDLFHEMERLSIGDHAHEFIVEAEGPLIAAEVTTGMMIPFVKSKLEEIIP